MNQELITIEHTNKGEYTSQPVYLTVRMPYKDFVLVIYAATSVENPYLNVVDKNNIDRRQEIFTEQVVTGRNGSHCIVKATATSIHRAMNWIDAVETLRQPDIHPINAAMVSYIAKNLPVLWEKLGLNKTELPTELDVNSDTNVYRLKLGENSLPIEQALLVSYLTYSTSYKHHFTQNDFVLNRQGAVREILDKRPEVGMMLCQMPKLDLKKILIENMAKHNA